MRNRLGKASSIAMMAVILLSLLGCESGGDSSSSADPGGPEQASVSPNQMAGIDLTGTWVFEDVTLNITQTGSTLTGTVTEDGRTYPEPLTGTIADRTVEWTIGNGGRWGRFNGTASADAMVGDFTKDSGSVHLHSYTKTG